MSREAATPDQMPMAAAHAAAEFCCVGIEVKAGATVGSGDIAGLRAFSEQIGSRFRHGIVLYTGRETVPFAANLHALLISALWTLATG